MDRWTLFVDVAVLATNGASMLLDGASVEVVNETQVHGVLQGGITEILLVEEIPATGDGQGSLEGGQVLPGGEDPVDLSVVEPEHGLVGRVIELEKERRVSFFIFFYFWEGMYVCMD